MLKFCVSASFWTDTHTEIILVGYILTIDWWYSVRRCYVVKWCEVVVQRGEVLCCGVM